VGHVTYLLSQRRKERIISDGAFNHLAFYMPCTNQKCLEYLRCIHRHRLIVNHFVHDSTYYTNVQKTEQDFTALSFEHNVRKVLEFCNFIYLEQQGFGYQKEEHYRKDSIGRL
jgi:hypothetical protein